MQGKAKLFVCGLFLAFLFIWFQALQKGAKGNNKDGSQQQADSLDYQEGKFVFVLWAEFIVAPNTTISVSAKRDVTIQNWDQVTHAIHWSVLPVGVPGFLCKGQSDSSFDCFVNPGMEVELVPLTVAGYYQFQDSTNGKTGFFTAID